MDTSLDARRSLSFVVLWDKTYKFADDVHCVMFMLDVEMVGRGSYVYTGSYLSLYEEMKLLSKTKSQ